MSESQENSCGGIGQQMTDGDRMKAILESTEAERTHGERSH